MKESNGEGKRWAIGILISIAFYFATTIYNYGQLTNRVDNNTERIGGVEKKVETMYNLFDNRLNTIIIGIGDLRVQGNVTASQLKTVRDNVKILQDDVKKLHRGK